MRVISSGQITPPDGLYRILELITAGSDVEMTILCIYSDSVNGVIGLDEGRYIRGARLVGDQTQGIPAIAALLTVKDGKYVLFRATAEEFQVVNQTLKLEIESLIKQHFEGPAVQGEEPPPVPTNPAQPEETQPIPPSIVKESRTIYEMRLSRASAAAAEAAAEREEAPPEPKSQIAGQQISFQVEEPEPSESLPEQLSEPPFTPDPVGDVPPAILAHQQEIIPQVATETLPEEHDAPVQTPIAEPMATIAPIPRLPSPVQPADEPPSFGFHPPPIPPLPQPRQQEQVAPILEPAAVAVQDQHEPSPAPNYPPVPFPAFQRQSFAGDIESEVAPKQVMPPHSVQPEVVHTNQPQAEHQELIQQQPEPIQPPEPVQQPTVQHATPQEPPAVQPAAYEMMPAPTVHQEPPQDISWPRIPPAYANNESPAPPSSVPSSSVPAPPIPRSERPLIHPAEQQPQDDGRSALGLRQSFDTPELHEEPLSPPSASPYILLACAVMIISFGVCVGVYLHQSQGKSIVETSATLPPPTTVKTAAPKPVAQPVTTAQPVSNLEKAKAALAAGNAKAALDECTAHLKNDPLNSEVRRLRLAAATQVSDWQTVVDDSFMLMKTAAATEKNNLLLARADAYLKLGKMDSAQVDFEELLKLDPQNKRAQQGIDDCRRALGGQQIAQETGSTQDGGSAEVNRLTQVLQANPQDWNSRKQLASTFLQKGQAVDAANQWQQLQAAGAVSVNEDLSFASQLAMTDHRSAASVYRNCIARNPRLADVRCLLAKEYAASGAVPEARAILQDGINISNSPDEKEMLRQMIRQVNETSAAGY